jgi:outer membrane protein
MRRGWLGLLLLAAGLFPAAAHAQSLLDFYRHALKSNPTLRSREFGIEQARALEDVAASRLLPQVSARGNYFNNDYRETGLAAQSYNGTRAVLQASQALLDFASYFRLQGAQFAVTQNELQRDAARMALGGDVVDRYLVVLQAGDEITHLRSEKASIEGQLKRLRFMRERGLVKVTDLFETEAYYQGLLTREIEASNTRAVALERLREITGVAVQQVAPLAQERFPAVPGREEQWVIDAARNNPNLTALEKAMDAVRSQIKSARSDHLPVLSLQASKTYSDQGYDNRLIPSYSVGTVGLQVDVPLYAGGRVQAAEREANARFEMARESLEGARREVESDTRTAYLTTVSSYARISSTNAEVQALERTLQAQQKSYEMGIATIVDVLNAQRLLLKSRSDQSKARYDYIRGLTTLRVHAGTLSIKDIEEIDGWMTRQGGQQPVGGVHDHSLPGALGLTYAASWRAPAAEQGPLRSQQGFASMDAQAGSALHPFAHGIGPAAAPLETTLYAAWTSAPAAKPFAHQLAAVAEATFSELPGLQGPAWVTAGKCVAPFDRPYLR